MLIDWRSDLAREDHRVFISGLPIAMHCHHYNINLQKTLEDTLGEEGVNSYSGRQRKRVLLVSNLSWVNTNESRPLSPN